jgi:hypothetical protein
MRNLFISILALAFFVQLNAMAQSPYKTFFGISKSIETNHGFHGSMFHLEEQIKFRPKIFFLGGLNFFYSNTIPDRKSGGDYSHRSLIPDAGLQFKINNSKKMDLFLNLGFTANFNKIKARSSYSTNSTGVDYDIKYYDPYEAGWGYRAGLSLGWNLSEKINFSTFLDSRFIAIKQEPTYVNLGLKMGFSR